MAGTLNDHMSTAMLPSAPQGVVGSNPIGQAFLAPLDEIDFGAIEQRHGIALHSDIDDLENHAKVGALEGVDPSNSLDTLAAKTDTHDGFEYMPKSRISELTNGRPCQAIMDVLSAFFHSPQLYHRRAVLRNRLDWLDRSVVASEASNLSLSAPIALPDELQGSTEGEELTPEDGGLTLHLATRVDGQNNQPLAATVTHLDTHENPQLDHLCLEAGMVDLGEVAVDGRRFQGDTAVAENRPRE